MSLDILMMDVNVVTPGKILLHCSIRSWCRKSIFQNFGICQMCAGSYCRSRPVLSSSEISEFKFVQLLLI